jgi:hypothetical protein
MERAERQAAELADMEELEGLFPFPEELKPRPPRGDGEPLPDNEYGISSPDVVELLREHDKRHQQYLRRKEKRIAAAAAKQQLPGNDQAK